MDRLEKAIEMAKEYNKTCLNTIRCEKCKYYNDNCELGNSIKVLLKWNKKIPKDKSIVLKNIDVSNVNFWEQRDKLIKDGEKFTDRVFDYIFYYDNYDSEKNYKYKKHAIEEFWNMVQYGLGLLQNININADEIMAEYPKHLQKMENQGKVEDIIKDTKKGFGGKIK